MPFTPPRSLYGAKLGDLNDVDATDTTDGNVVTRQADGTFALDVLRPERVLYVSGMYYGSQNPTSWATTFSAVADRLHLIPFSVSSDVTWDEIYLHVNTSGAGNCRLGIFTGGVNSQTFTRAIDAGTVSIATTGTKSITGLNFAATKGQLLWLAFLPSVDFVVTACNAAALTEQITQGSTAATSGFVTGIRVVATYSAGLPASESGAWINLLSNTPIIGLRKA